MVPMAVAEPTAQTSTSPAQSNAGSTNNKATQSTAAAGQGQGKLSSRGVSAQ